MSFSYAGRTFGTCLFRTFFMLGALCAAGWLAVAVSGLRYHREKRTAMIVAGSVGLGHALLFLVALVAVRCWKEIEGTVRQWGLWHESSSHSAGQRSNRAAELCCHAWTCGLGLPYVGGLVAMIVIGAHHRGDLAAGLISAGAVALGHAVVVGAIVVPLMVYAWIRMYRNVGIADET